MIRVLVVATILFPSVYILANEKRKCLPGKHWVAPHFRRAYIKYDGTRVTAAQIKGHCRKNPRGYKEWHQRLSNKRPKIWGYTKEKSKKWSIEEIERFLSAISVLPDRLVDLDGSQVYRMFRSQDGENPATTNPPQKDITLYDLAFVHEDSLAQILSHELSHILFEALSPGEKREFANEAGWVARNIMGREYYFPKEGKLNIKSDSIKSLEEDFANHIELYLFRAGIVRTKSIKGYRWIRNKFGQKFKIKEGL